MCSDTTLFSIARMSKPRKLKDNDRCQMIPKIPALAKQSSFGDSTSATTAIASDDTDDTIASPPVWLSESRTTATADHDGGTNNDDGPATPTSPDSRIPKNPPCPPAPKKPKSRPIRKRRRSADHDTSVCSSSSRLLDFCKEVESLYSPPNQANLGRKIKKARSV